MNSIEIKNVNFVYQGEKGYGLKDINLEVKQGEFVLITGRSGCGKTTLTRLINGLIPHFYSGEITGTVRVNGQEVYQISTYDLAEMIGSVFQDPRSQFFTTNTTAEVAFGCENLNLTSEKIVERVDMSFQDFQIEGLKNKNIFDISSGEKQKVALASTYAMLPGIYILDEPSANLDINSTKKLCELLKTLKEQGATIIISEHRLYYLMELADRILFMQNGEITQELTPEEAMKLTEFELIKKGLRAFDIKGITLPKNKQKASFISVPEVKVSDVLLTLSSDFILQDVSFSVNPQNRNSIIGITGENGAGKTTLVKYLCGLLKSKKGTVKVNGSILQNRQRTHETYLVMQDTDYQLFTDSVEDELRLGNKKGLELDEKINDILDILGLSKYRDSHPMSLSGGQKQRVTIASAAVNSANILFFDEPTSGLDGYNMRNVSKILYTLNQSGKLIFVISHDLEFLLNTCGRIIHLDNGKIVEDFLLTNMTVEKLKRLLFSKIT